MLLNFQRPFKIWVYSVSRSQLLLRSVKSDDFPTRIDILFGGVASINIPTEFFGLSLVEEVISKEVPSIGTSVLDSRKVYRLSGDSYEGSLVAFTCTWHEDEKAYYEESEIYMGMNPLTIHNVE